MMIGRFLIAMVRESRLGKFKEILFCYPKGFDSVRDAHGGEEGERHDRLSLWYTRYAVCLVWCVDGVSIQSYTFEEAVEIGRRQLKYSTNAKLGSYNPTSSYCFGLCE